MEKKQSLRIAVVLIELLILVNASFMAFVMGAWIEGEAFAYYASESDWWIEAGKRLILASFISALAAVLARHVNRAVFARIGFNSERLTLVTANILFGSLCLSGLAGAIFFALTKPYM